jgi:ribose 5-phosphate isomerase A
MSDPSKPSEADRNALKRASARAAVELVRDGMIVGLGTGSTAAFALEALAERHRQGLRFLGIPTSVATGRQAAKAGIPLTSFAEHGRIDLTIDGADEVESGTLNLIKGHGGALLREKIVAAASDRLVIVADACKSVSRLGGLTPVPVEVTPFGLEPAQAALQALGCTIQRRRGPGGEAFETDGGNHILDCRFGAIDAPAQLEADIRRIVGVVESGLFVGRADVAFVADLDGVVRRRHRPRAHNGRPFVLVVMGVSGVGKTSVAQALAARLGWPFEEGDGLHPPENVAKMAMGAPLTDADRRPWLEAVASWIDGQRARGRPGVITCSALKRAYREVIIGDRPEVKLVYLRGDRSLIANRLAKRRGHFMPPGLLSSQFDALEEPTADEGPLTVGITQAPEQIAQAIIDQLAATVAAATVEET